MRGFLMRQTQYMHVYVPCMPILFVIQYINLTHAHTGTVYDFHL